MILNTNLLNKDILFVLYNVKDCLNSGSDNAVAYLN